MNTASKLAISGIIALSLSSVAYAAQVKSETLVKPGQTKMLKLQMPNKQFKHKRSKHKKPANFARSWHRALYKLEPLTTTEAKTVANGAIVLYGKNNMQLQNIIPVTGKRGQQLYKVEVANQQGKTLGTLIMNGSNGHIMRIAK